jgi:predicted phosphoribosyltransferase
MMNTMGPFADRAAAGRALAPPIARRLLGGARAIVLALPRGGVPVAAQVADALEAPLDVLLVRKLGVPGHEELAFGALATGGVSVLNERVVEMAELQPDAMRAVAARESVELERRERRYRGDRPPVDVADATVVVVDDGLATGATMRAAVAALRRRGAARIVVAAPVGSPDACDRLAGEADAVVCLRRPRVFRAVGAWYEDFSEVSDAEVAALLATHPSTLAPAGSSGPPPQPSPQG